MPAKTIAVIVSDLMFQSRLREQVTALDYEIAVADTPDAVDEALAAGPALVILDLHIAGIDWRQAVAMAKERDAPVLAFGRHTEAELLRSAREAGCDRVVPRSTLVQELPELVKELAGERA